VSGRILEIHSADELPQFDLSSADSPSVVVFHPDVDLPLQPGVLADPAFELREEFMPYGYRHRYLHPSLYQLGAFHQSVRDRLDTLRALLKHGGAVLFLIDPEQHASLLHACCFMGHCFQGCANPPGSLCAGVTVVPFPLKMSRSRPTAWIWSCCWPTAFGRRVEGDQDVEAFAHQQSLDFATYDDACFPVEAVKPGRDGVSAFTVRVGSGQLAVAPAHAETDDVLDWMFPPAEQETVIRVTSVPRPVYTGKPGATCLVHLKIRSAPRVSETYAAPMLEFLRFASLLFASHGHRKMRYKRKSGDDRMQLENLWLADQGGEHEYPHEYLFKNRQDQTDKNFLSVLGEALNACLLPDEVDAESQARIRQATGLPPARRRRPTDHGGYTTVKLSNVRLEFTEAGLAQFQELTVALDESDQRTTRLAAELDGLRRDVLTLIQ
jgi:hypothetical protein